MRSTAKVDSVTRTRSRRRNASLLLAGAAGRPVKNRLLMAKMITWIERFEAGDYPMICARSGLPADKFVPVEASRSAAWPWIFSPFDLPFWITRWSVGKDRLWGKMPFASGQVKGSLQFGIETRVS